MKVHMTTAPQQCREYVDVSLPIFSTGTVAGKGDELDDKLDAAATTDATILGV